MKINANETKAKVIGTSGNIKKMLRLEELMQKKWLESIISDVIKCKKEIKERLVIRKQTFTKNIFFSVDRLRNIWGKARLNILNGVLCYMKPKHGLFDRKKKINWKLLKRGHAGE